MSNILQEYLVKLWFEPDEPSYRKLQTLMADAELAVTSHSGGMLKRVLEFQTGVVGAFTGVSAAILGMADKAAMADQGYRLMGLHMMMGAESARKLDMISKALGADLQDIVWDPELHARALAMSGDIDRMSAALGPKFTDNMKGIRDIRFEFSRLEVATKFLGMGFASDLFNKLFPNRDMMETVHKWMDRFEQKIPEISDKLSTYAVPVLKETWGILKDLGEVIREGALAFTNLVGLISGDNSIEGTEFSFDHLAKAILHVAEAMREIVKALSDAEAVVAHLAGAASDVATGKPVAAGKEMSKAGEHLNVGSELTLGGLVAGGAGTLWGLSKLLAVAKGIAAIPKLAAAASAGASIPAAAGAAGASAGASIPAAAGAAGAEAGGAAAGGAAGAGGLTLAMYATAAAAGVGAGAAIARSQKENWDKRNQTTPPGWLAEHSETWRDFQIWVQRHIYGREIPPQPGEKGYTGPNTAPAPAAAPVSQSAPAPQAGEFKITIPDTKDNLAYITKNPGNLRYAGQEGATEYKGFAKFATPEAGYRALLRQVDIRARQGETLGEYIREYAPAKDHNDTTAYLKNAMEALRVPETVKLSAIDHEALAKFQIKQESGSTVTSVIQQAAAPAPSGPAAIPVPPPSPAREAVIQREVKAPLFVRPPEAPAAHRILYEPQRGLEDIAARVENSPETAPRWIASAPAWYGMRPEWLDHEPAWWAKPALPASVPAVEPQRDAGGHLPSLEARRAVLEPVWYAQAPTWLDRAPDWWGKIVAPAINVSGATQPFAPTINWAPVLADMQRPSAPAATIANSTRTFTVDVGGIFITQPGADERAIARAVESGIKGALDQQTQFDLAQLTPVWG